MHPLSSVTFLKPLLLGDLIPRQELSWSCLNNSSRASTMSKAVEEQRDFEFRWTIENFFSLPKTMDYFLRSARFNFSGAPWFLKMYPNGETMYGTEGSMIGVYLTRRNSGPPVCLSYTLSLKTTDNKTKEEHFSHDFYNINHGWGSPKFLSKSQLLERKSTLAPSGSLTIICSIRCHVGSINESEKKPEKITKPGVPPIDKFTQTKTGVCEKTSGVPSVNKFTQTKTDVYEKKQEATKASFAPVNKFTQTKGDLYEKKPQEATKASFAPANKFTQTKGDLCLDMPEAPGKNDKANSCELDNKMPEAFIKLQQELKELLYSGRCSDVVLRVKDKEFHAHTSILAARSPVFAAMMEHDMLERATGTVDIEDTDPDSFPDFLHYLYTGCWQNLTPSNVLNLYETADKYQVEDLKKVCLKQLVDNMSVDNFCEVLTLSLRHQVKELIDAATQFCMENSMAIVTTTEWQIFLSEYPVASNQLVIKMLQARK